MLKKINNPLLWSYHTCLKHQINQVAYKSQRNQFMEVWLVYKLKILSRISLSYKMGQIQQFMLEITGYCLGQITMFGLALFRYMCMGKWQKKFDCIQTLLRKAPLVYSEGKSMETFGEVPYTSIKKLPGTHQ